MRIILKAEGEIWRKMNRSSRFLGIVGLNLVAALFHAAVKRLAFGAAAPTRARNGLGLLQRRWPANGAANAMVGMTFLCRCIAEAAIAHGGVRRAW